MIIVALAAVLVLAMGSMITGVGSKPYWRVLWDRVMGDDETSVINIENMDSQKTENINELDTYQEIKERLGVSAVRLRKKPENMYLERYSIDSEQRYAILFYNYNGEIIKYSVYLNDSDSSFGQSEPDKLVNEYKIKINSSIINVEEYCIEGKEDKRYIAKFQYRDVNYQLKGVMEKEKFVEILKNLQFF